MQCARATPRALGRSREAVLLGVITILAARLRWHGLPDLALSHTDEGSYALSAAATARGEFPQGLAEGQRFLAPPLLVLVAGFLARWGGLAVDFALHCTSAAAGTATVVVAHCVGRSWFGPVAGLCSALLVALMGDHRQLSRIGLTDVLFGLWFLLALLALGRMLRRLSVVDAVLAGVATGLAWNTKYHGWLAVPVAGLAAAPRILLGTERLRLLLLLAVAAGTAAALYAPWALHVQGQPGGYAALLQNHAGYLQSAGAFLEHARIQLAAQQVLDDGPAVLALPVAVVVLALAGGGGRQAWLRGGAVGLGAAALSLWIGTAGAWGLLAAGCCLCPPAGSTQGARLAAAFFACFTVLTPLYHPYARLLLPWKLASALLVGALVQRLLSAEATWPERRARAAALAALALAAAALGTAGLPHPDFGPQQPDLRAAAAAIAAVAEPRVPVLVMSEPGLCFHLRERGADSWPIEGVWAVDGAPPGSVLLVVAGYHARRRGDLERWLAGHPGAGELVLTTPARLGPVRLLDDQDPSAAAQAGRDEPAPYRCEVFRIRR